MFIALDGNDGVGKTTIAPLLAAAITERYGLDTLVTREPGGGSLGEHIRDYFKSNLNTLTPVEAIPLIFAARFNHLRESIIPALSEGKVVICDRWNLSTYAYQLHDYADIPEIHSVYDQLLKCLDAHFPIGAYQFVIRSNFQAERTDAEFKLKNDNAFLNAMYAVNLTGIPKEKAFVAWNKAGAITETVNYILGCIEGDVGSRKTWIRLPSQEKTPFHIIAEKLGAV